MILLHISSFKCLQRIKPQIGELGLSEGPQNQDISSRASVLKFSKGRCFDVQIETMWILNSLFHESKSNLLFKCHEQGKLQLLSEFVQPYAEQTMTMKQTFMLHTLYTLFEMEGHQVCLNYVVYLTKPYIYDVFIKCRTVCKVAFSKNLQF